MQVSLQRKGISFGDIIVVKIGTAALSDVFGAPDIGMIKSLAFQMAPLRLEGRRVLVVSSGAVGFGRAKASLSREDTSTVSGKALAASIGQPALMAAYGKALAPLGCVPAQVLMNSQYFSNGVQEAQKNVLSYLDEVFKTRAVLPIFNENDVTSHREIEPLAEGNADTFSDNDGLANIIGRLVGAKRMIMVSTHAVYTKNPCDPSAELVPVINFASDIFNPVALGLSTEGASNCGRGGMENKLTQARSFLQDGPCGERSVHIISKEEALRDGITRLVAGEGLGTHLVCGKPSAMRGLPCGPKGYICS